MDMKFIDFFCLETSCQAPIEISLFYSITNYGKNACAQYLFLTFYFFQLGNVIPVGYKKNLVFSNVKSPSECAKICIHAKFCSCTSFSFNKPTEECVMSDR